MRTESGGGKEKQRRAQRIASVFFYSDAKLQVHLIIRRSRRKPELHLVLLLFQLLSVLLKRVFCHSSCSLHFRLLFPSSFSSTLRSFNFLCFEITSLSLSVPSFLLIVVVVLRTTFLSVPLLSSSRLRPRRRTEVPLNAGELVNFGAKRSCRRSAPFK